MYRFRHLEFEAGLQMIGSTVMLCLLSSCRCRHLEKKSSFVHESPHLKSFRLRRYLDLEGDDSPLENVFWLGFYTKLSDLRVSYEIR